MGCLCTTSAEPHQEGEARLILSARDNAIIGARAIVSESLSNQEAFKGTLDKY